MVAPNFLDLKRRRIHRTVAPSGKRVYHVKTENGKVYGNKATFRKGKTGTRTTRIGNPMKVPNAIRRLM